MWITLIALIKYPDKSDLRERRFIWVPGSRKVTMAREMRGGGVVSHSQSGSRELGTLVLSSLSPFSFSLGLLT